MARASGVRPFLFLLGEAMFELIALVIAVVAILMVRNAGKRIAKLEQHTAALEARLAGGAAPAATSPTAAPLPDALLLETEPVTPAAPAATAPEPVMQEAAPALPPELPPAAPAEPAKSFEERFGASWVVWIGGIALALGGIFLVQYSIEAGLIGPGVRIALGALLAAALTGAGEWTRRRDQAAGFAGLPNAHIPSIPPPPAPPSPTR
jgi:uncharacterized membrane protein